MTQITKEQIDNIPIEQILQRYGIEPKRGRFKCPFHNGENKGACSIKHNRVHCFVCGESFGSLKFTQRMENVDRKQAIGLLGQWFGIEVDRPLTREEKREYARRRAEREQEAREKAEEEKRDVELRSWAIGEMRKLERQTYLRRLGNSWCTYGSWEREKQRVELLEKFDELYWSI